MNESKHPAAGMLECFWYSTCSCCCHDFYEYLRLLSNKQKVKPLQKTRTFSVSLLRTHGPTAVSALHGVWQSLALARPLRNGHSPSGASAVTLCVLKVVIPLQTQTHYQFEHMPTWIFFLLSILYFI